MVMMPQVHVPIANTPLTSALARYADPSKMVMDPAKAYREGEALAQKQKQDAIMSPILAKLKEAEAAKLAEEARLMEDETKAATLKAEADMLAAEKKDEPLTTEQQQTKIEASYISAKANYIKALKEGMPPKSAPTDADDYGGLARKIYKHNNPEATDHDLNVAEKGARQEWRRYTVEQKKQIKDDANESNLKYGPQIKKKETEAVKDVELARDPEIAYQKTLREGAAQQVNTALTKKYDEAKDSLSALKTIEQSRNILREGMHVGAFANFKVGVSKIARDIFGFNKFDDEAANAEAFGANQADLVAKVIKAFGSGTGLSDADREFAKKLAGGDIEMSEKALEKILLLQEYSAKYRVNSYNKDAQIYGRMPIGPRQGFDLEDPRFEGIRASFHEEEQWNDTKGSEWGIKKKGEKKKSDLDEVNDMLDLLPKK